MVAQSFWDSPDLRKHPRTAHGIVDRAARVEHQSPFRRYWPGIGRISLAIHSARDPGLLRTVRLLAEELGLALAGVLSKPARLHQSEGLLTHVARGGSAVPAEPARSLTCDDVREAFTSGWVVSHRSADAARTGLRHGAGLRILPAARSCSPCRVATTRVCCGPDRGRGRFEGSRGCKQLPQREPWVSVPRCQPGRGDQTSDSAGVWG
jgi:hypothetical protein